MTASLIRTTSTTDAAHIQPTWLFVRCVSCYKLELTLRSLVVDLSRTVQWVTTWNYSRVISNWISTDSDHVVLIRDVAVDAMRPSTTPSVAARLKGPSADSDGRARCRAGLHCVSLTSTYIPQATVVPVPQISDVNRYPTYHQLETTSKIKQTPVWLAVYISRRDLNVQFFDKQ